MLAPRWEQARLDYLDCMAWNTAGWRRNTRPRTLGSWPTQTRAYLPTARQFFFSLFSPSLCLSRPLLFSPVKLLFSRRCDGSMAPTRSECVRPPCFTLTFSSYIHREGMKHSCAETSNSPDL